MHLPEPILPLDPLTTFMLIMLIILFLPRIFERLRLPGLVGLIIGGLILGPRGFGLMSPDGETTKFLAEVGKLMVMFFAGLEIDMQQFKRTGHKSMTYGLATFAIPLAVGLMSALLFGYSWITAILIGSLLASHTLLALPILIKNKLMKKECITVTIGATMFTDVAALTILAVCLAIHTVGFDGGILAARFIGMAIYIPVILIGAKYLAPICLKRMSESEDSQVLYVMLLMIIAAVGAEAIHLEGIVGAFIVGLAVGEVVHEGEIRSKLDTLGNTLFIPMFFLLVGSLIDPLSFLRMTPKGIVFMVIIVGGLISSKFLAAALTGKLLGYNRNETLCMWSLSMPQVAATLAAALVAHEAVNSAGAHLIDEATLDSILILVMVTAILGPILTQRFAKRLTTEQ